MTEIHPYTNHLKNEKSPYLQQHAHNPVDWHPWGENAFELAAKLDKPIFLSIGYATCHWCHVMEKESFENPEIAYLMNDAFINIKIDREELPYIDNLYMEFAQSMMAGSAGWPLNVILTPKLLPFFATTYLPAHNKQGMMGLSELIQRIRDVWNSEEREHIIDQSEKILEVFAESIHTQGDELPEKEQIEDTVELIFKMSDPVHGGMKGAPKFPIGYQNNLLMHYSATMQDSRAMFIVEKTLDMMHRGGIYDQLGGGFSRYSVDEEWLVPHFEKMLYDNALLIYCYLEAWQIEKKALYKEVCEETIGYVLNDMKHPDGGFYSAEDADSEGLEGKFYTWTLEEIRNILGIEECKLFCEYYNVTEKGNFEGRNILNTRMRLEEFAIDKKLNLNELQIQLGKQRKILLSARNRRVRPFKDDKILSSWNGLMIHALAEAGAAFNDLSYQSAALQAAKFIKEKMWIGNILYHRWRDQETRFGGGLEDYAFMIKGLLSLFEISGDREWLEWAMEMTDYVYNNFKEDEGAFYQTECGEKNLILRKTQFSDGAEPSGNAVHCENLLRLYQLTLTSSYLEQAEDILRGAKQFLDSYSPGYAYHIMNLNRYYNRHAPTLIIALNEKEEHKGAISNAIYTNFIPHKAVLWKKASDHKIGELCPYVKNLEPADGQTTLYICLQGTCQKPLSTLNEIIGAIGKI